MRNEPDPLGLVKIVIGAEIISDMSKKNLLEYPGHP